MALGFTAIAKDAQPRTRRLNSQHLPEAFFPDAGIGGQDFLGLFVEMVDGCV